LIVGGEMFLGSWRRDFEFTCVGDLGMRFMLGSPHLAGVITLLYTPGVAFAEGRVSGVYLAYRAMLGMQIRDFELGLSWREVGRSANSTLRTAELFLSWGF